ncbi:MAG TPA: permease-like cell division protein FtsX [Candidatus Methylomirabilis sp.]|nr:permease-like cell division protein FtsX [Candidatus Methylomirabilis sp.]
MLEKLKHVFAHALINLVRAGWGGLASIATIGVSFVIIGIFLLLILHFNALVAEWKEQFQVSVFLDDKITPTQLEILGKRIQNETAIKAITFTTKEEALANFRRELRGQESLLEGLGDNPLPASFQLKIREGYQSPDALRRLSAFLSRLEGVEDVQYGQDWIERISNAARIMKILGMMIGSVLTLGSAMIVSNTIRLAVYARAAEVEIMRLVGATKAYIRAPFVVEGMLQGGLGALLALGLLFAAYRFVAPTFNLASPIFQAAGDPGFLESSMMAGLVGGGAVIGALGSLMAVRRFLKM